MFKIPNAVDAEHVSQAQHDSRDFADIIIPAFGGTGVLTGCAVTPQGSPNMTLAVASGVVAVAGVFATVTGGNVTVTTAHATLDRFDLVCVDNAGTKSVVAGTAAAAPVFPDPAGKVVLAAVRVPAAIGSINSAKLVDKRVNAVDTMQGYTAYTPVWSSPSTPPSLGNGSIAGAWIKYGKKVHCYGSISAGSTTTFGTAGASWLISLPTPVPAVNVPGWGLIGMVTILQNNAGVIGFAGASTTDFLTYMSTTHTGLLQQSSSNYPITPNSTFILNWNLIYRTT